MNRALATSVALLGACTVSARADETGSISLKDIWAYQMPGTHDIRELEPKVYGVKDKDPPVEEQERRFRESLIHHILRALAPPKMEKEGPVPVAAPEPGFVVVGTGKHALREVHAVLVDKKVSNRPLPANSELTLVFFSHFAGSYVHLSAVKRQGGVIEIDFCFVPHFTSEVSSHFALIPLGKLLPGKYSVKISELPVAKPVVGADSTRLHPDWQRELICKPFEFTIVKGTGERK